MKQEELKDILDKHSKWLRKEEGGEQADLYGADLYGADLGGADLRSAELRSAELGGAELGGADLRGADLGGANLRGANLRSADLGGVDLRSADLGGANLYGVDLRSADLRGIKDDFFQRLSLAKNEVTGLYDHLMRGEIDGYCYEGDCCCFVGTIAKVAGQHYAALTSGLKPDSASPTESWFLSIRKGDTPASNQAADITREWLVEFAAQHQIELPKFRR